jgi:hypothetical protein
MNETLPFALAALLAALVAVVLARFTHVRVTTIAALIGDLTTEQIQTALSLCCDTTVEKPTVPGKE